METKSTREFDVQQFQAIAAEIDETTFDYLKEQIQKQMPDSHATLSTLYYITLRLATKAICVICENDQTARQRAVTDFCKKLPKLVREAKIIATSTRSDLKQ